MGTQANRLFGSALGALGRHAGGTLLLAATGLAATGLAATGTTLEPTGTPAVPEAGAAELGSTVAVVVVAGRRTDRGAAESAEDQPGEGDARNGPHPEHPVLQPEPVGGLGCRLDGLVADGLDGLDGLALGGFSLVGHGSHRADPACGEAVPGR